MSIQIGDILGDYEVTGVLGRGGMGKVFRVRSLLTQREEAMKVVLSDLDQDPDLADRFLREIQVHASLQHPNIAALHTALRIEGRLVMLLELVEGVSLEQMLRDGPIDVCTSAGYIIQVLEALACAHDRGVIHRDIKPANILIASGGVVKLTDFGIARSSGAARLTGTGLAVGTLAYMSPEQILSRPIDTRSDLYSLGLTFYEMVVGSRAMQADTEHALMNAQLSVTPPAPAVVNPLVPVPISAAIMRALRKEPGRRFQTALEFKAALQQPNQNQSEATPGASAIPAPELAELQASLARAIGPIAMRLVPDAARRYGTISEIRQALAAQIEDPRHREVFLRTNPAASTTQAQTSPAAASFEPAMLDRLARALAPHLGPIAKVLVSRAARSAGSAEELQNALAAEIPTAEDRRRFLAAVRSPL
jgi:eukaryotic-like serine/threonine-protein kinase